MTIALDAVVRAVVQFVRIGSASNIGPKIEPCAGVVVTGIDNALTTQAGHLDASEHAASRDYAVSDASGTIDIFAMSAVKICYRTPRGVRGTLWVHPGEFYHILADASSLITVRIIEEGTGRPLAAANVQIAGVTEEGAQLQLDLVTDESGSFEVPGGVANWMVTIDRSLEVVAGRGDGRPIEFVQVAPADGCWRARVEPGTREVTIEVGGNRVAVVFRNCQTGAAVNGRLTYGGEQLVDGGYRGLVRGYQSQVLDGEAHFLLRDVDQVAKLIGPEHRFTFKVDGFQPTSLHAGDRLTSDMTVFLHPCGGVELLAQWNDGSTVNDRVDVFCLETGLLIAPRRGSDGSTSGSLGVFDWCGGGYRAVLRSSNEGVVIHSEAAGHSNRAIITFQGQPAAITVTGVPPTVEGLAALSVASEWAVMDPLGSSLKFSAGAETGKWRLARIPPGDYYVGPGALLEARWWAGRRNGTEQPVSVRSGQDLEIQWQDAGLLLAQETLEGKLILPDRWKFRGALHPIYAFGAESLHYTQVIRSAPALNLGPSGDYSIGAGTPLPTALLVTVWVEGARNVERQRIPVAVIEPGGEFRLEGDDLLLRMPDESDLRSGVVRISSRAARVQQRCGDGRLLHVDVALGVEWLPSADLALPFAASVRKDLRAHTTSGALLGFECVQDGDGRYCGTIRKREAKGEAQRKHFGPD